MTNAQLPPQVSEIFDPQQWRAVQGFKALEDVTYHRGVDRDKNGNAVKDLPWARKVTAQSPQAVRMLKYAFNLPDDGMVGQQVFAGEATRMGHMTDEAVEGREAFLQKRDPDWSAFPYYF